MNATNSTNNGTSPVTTSGAHTSFSPGVYMGIVIPIFLAMCLGCFFGRRFLGCSGGTMVQASGRRYPFGTVLRADGSTRWNPIRRTGASESESTEHVQPRNLDNLMRHVRINPHESPRPMHPRYAADEESVPPYEGEAEHAPPSYNASEELTRATNDR